MAETLLKTINITASLPNDTHSYPVNIFYREAGSPSLPTLLLLHGFPSSSHQYRDLIPLLSDQYHVIAPDFPYFGFTSVSPSQPLPATFAALTAALSALFTALQLAHFAIYIFDYGAPVGLRYALQNPSAITAIISQNGNAYKEGLGSAFTGPGYEFWNSTNSPADRAAAQQAFLTFDAFKAQYETGVPDAASVIAPETYWLDWALEQRLGDANKQLDLLYDYKSNIDMYPLFQKYLRESEVPVLAVWGKNDVIFVPPGAEAFQKDVKDAEIVLLDAGHFAVESKGPEIAGLVKNFLGRKEIS